MIILDWVSRTQCWLQVRSGLLYAHHRSYPDLKYGSSCATCLHPDPPASHYHILATWTQPSPQVLRIFPRKHTLSSLFINDENSRQGCLGHLSQAELLLTMSLYWSPFLIKSWYTFRGKSIYFQLLIATDKNNLQFTTQGWAYTACPQSAQHILRTECRKL